MLKIVSSWSRISGPVTCCQGGHQETPPTKAPDVMLQHPQSAQRHMCDIQYGFLVSFFLNNYPDWMIKELEKRPATPITNLDIGL